jgi:nucleoside transporter
MDSTLRLKLSVMMFLQYAVWGAWAVSMGTYCGATLKFEGIQIGSIYSTTAIAAMISPLFMGIVADRLFATEKVIAVLHLVGGGLLLYAANLTDFPTLYAVMVAYALCYMPTLALTNSISFANISDPEKQFPGIRVWGTWGWIVAGWIVGFVLDAKSNVPLQLAGGLSILLGLFSFALPHTPPRGHLPAAEQDTKSGQGIGQLLGDPSFLLFVIASFLICIPLSLYYGFANVFLTEIEAPYPTALQTIGQMSEVGFMAAMPFFITRLGVKNMLAIGMLAWVARYVCFGTLSFPLVVVGLILHGVCYDFFFVASQIYVDNRVTGSQRSAAQSFIAFVTLGLGMFVGAYVGGYIVDKYPSPHQALIMVTDAAGKTEPKSVVLPAWDAKGESGFAKDLGLKAGDTLVLTQLPESITDGTTTIPGDALAKALANADKNGDKAIDRAEWVAARQHQWPMIWAIPAGMALITCLIFYVGFRNPKVESAPAAA